MVKQIWGRLAGGEGQGDLVGVPGKIILVPSAPGFLGCGSPGAEQIGPASLQQGGRGDGLWIGDAESGGRGYLYGAGLLDLGTELVIGNTGIKSLLLGIGQLL